MIDYGEMWHSVDACWKCRELIVRTTDLDQGRHVNGITYLRSTSGNRAGEFVNNAR